MVKVQLELEGEVAEVIWGLSRIGGGAPDVAQSLAGPQTAAAERKPAGTPAVPEPGTTATSATLLPGRWTQELAADFTSGLDVVARRVMFQVWRAGAAGIHRNTLCQRTDLSPVELRSVLMRMGHVLRRFQRERGMALSRRWRPTARCRATSSTPNSPRWRPICSLDECVSYGAGKNEPCIGC